MVVIRYVSLQSLVYAIGQFIFLFASWYSNRDFGSKRRADMAVIVVVALPLMPLLRELKAIKWPAYLAWHSQIHFFITGGFLCGVTYFEYAIQQRFRLAPAVVLHLLFKLVMGDSFLDISAVFLAYATASPAVASTASVEAVLPILTILALLGVIFILALAWRKVKLSIHYNARVLRLLKYRHELEVAVTKHIIGKNMVSSPLDLKHIDSSQSSQGMFREAVREGIFATPHDFSDLNVSRRGAERHLTAMIAVMQCFTGEHDSIQNIRNRAYIHKFLDELAKIHKITPVRKFRGLWIGSLGFFDTWEQSRLNSCHVVQMASEITLLSRRFGWQLCTAIDQGSIIGGYIGEQMNFDILGSEVQWVMSTVDEVHAPHEICISAAVRAALMSDSVAKSGIFSVDVTFRTIRTRMSEAETVYVIDNAPDLVKLTLEEIVSIYSKVSLLDEVPIDWDHVQRIWKSDALGFFNQGKQWEQLGAFAEAPLDESDDLSGSDFTTPSSNMNNNQSYRYDGSTSASMSSVALYGKSRKLDIRRSLNTRSESNLSDDRSEAGDLDSHDGDIRSHAARIQGKESQNNSAFRPVNPELDADPGGGKLKDSFKKKRRRSSFFGNPNEFLSSFLSPSATDMDMLDRMEEIYFFKAQDKGRDTDFYLRNKCSLMTDTSSILHPHEITLAAGVLTFKYYFKEIMQIDSLMEIVEGFWQELRDFALGEEDLHAINRNFYFSETLPNPIQVLITLSKELPLVGLNFLFNTGVMSWHILFYLLMNEPFDFYNYPLLLKIVSVISGFTEKLIKSKVHPTDMASEGHLVGNISEFDDRISDIEHTFESPNLALSNNLQTVGNISAARMWEPSSRNPKKSEAYKLANDSKPLWGYCRNVRKNIGLNMIYVMWLLSLSTVILATHAKINSVGSKNAGAFSFQYLGIIYMICILLMYEHAMESKIVYFIGLVAKLVLVLVFPLYLETLDDNHATAFAEIVVSHQTRHVNALYLVFVHLLLGSFVRPLRYAYLECVVIVSGIMLRYLILDGHEQKHFDIEDRIQLLSFFVAFMLIANILLEYYITLCYVLETLLSPHATAAMLHQHEMTRSVISIFMPSVSPEVGIKFMNMKRYGNCSVITMHVKPYQTLPSLVSEKEAAAFLLLFHRMLDACFTECGFVRLCRFSGVFVAVTSDDADFGQNLSKLRQNVSCRRRALLCAKFVQKRLEAFNRTYKVNTAVGVSIMSGALSLGVIDANDITLSVCGNIVSIGSMLAVREADSIVVDDSFATEAKKMVNKRFTILLPGYVAPSKFYSLVLDEGSFGGQGRKLNDFTYIAMLGRGGYGSVHLVTMNQYNIKYAIKCIPKRKGGAASDVMITREFLILTQMKHPNVMALKYCIMSESCVYLVMEYVRGGNLKQIIEKYDPELSTLKLWFAELILAIEYVHSLGIQHRDVKPVNCMIHTDGHLKLGDFGLAKIVGDDLNSSTIRDTDVITDNSDSSDSYGDQMIKALTIMQKVLPIRHHTTHVEGGAQLSGLIQAIVFDTDIGRGQQTCVVLRNMMIEATFQETSKDMWKLLDDPQSSVDLILIDLGSDLDGPDWALFNELRARSNSESIPRIVLSAFDYKDLEDKAIALGAKMFILHPLDVHVHRDAIISQGMIRRQWRYEENGENITESRQLISSSGINAQSRRYSHQNRVTGGSIFSPNKNEQRISPSSKVHGSSSFFPNTDTRSSPLIMEGYSKPLTANAVQTASVPSSFTAQYSLQDGLEQKNGAEKLLPSSSSRILFDDVSPALTAAGDEKRGAPATTIALSSEIKESDHHSGDIQITGDTDARNMFKSMHTVKEASGSFKISGNFLAFAGGRKKTPQASPAIDAWTNKEVIEKKPVGELNSAVGTAHFMAPEIITDRIYDKSVDWWACGVTFYYCITKQHLFKGSDPNAIFRNILRGDPDLSKLDNNADLIPLKSLIAGFLEKDYKNRLGSSSTRVIKEHPFFLPSFQDICSQAPTLHPQQLEEVTVTQAERDAGEELFLNRKTVKRKVRVTTTSFSTTASGNLGSRRHKSSSKNKKSKKMSNMKRFNRVANSIRDYSIAETDENEDSGGDSHHYDSDAHNLDQSSVASRTEEGKILHEENDSNGIECDKS